MSFEVELNVELPDDTEWRRDLEDTIERWLDSSVLAVHDGQRILGDEHSVTLRSHSVVQLLGPWR